MQLTGVRLAARAPHMALNFLGLDLCAQSETIVASTAGPTRKPPRSRHSSTPNGDLQGRQRDYTRRIKMRFPKRLALCSSFGFLVPAMTGALTGVADTADGVATIAGPSPAAIDLGTLGGCGR